MKSTLRIIGAVVVIGVALLFAAAQLGNLGGDKPAADPGQDLSLAHKFAIVSAGHMVPPDDPSVKKAEHYLPRAAEFFREPDLQIAEMSAAAAKQARKEGVADVSALDVLEAVAIAKLHGSYADGAAIYVGLRSSGQNHLEASAAMRGIERAFAGK